MNTPKARDMTGPWSGHGSIRSDQPRRPSPDTGRGALRSDLPSVPSRGRLALRHLLFQLWARLPSWSQRLVVRLAAPRVTLGVCAVILDAQRRLLLAHHSYRRWSGGWGLPGGFARGDEQPAEALMRELREELGVDALIGPLLGAETATAVGHLTLYYHATLAGTPRPDGAEIDACQYVTLSEAAALLGTPAPSWLRQAQARLTHERGRAECSVMLRKAG